MYGKVAHTYERFKNNVRSVGYTYARAMVLVRVVAV